MNGNGDWLVLDIMFMVPEIDACLTLAFSNRQDVALKLAAFHLFISQRQSALTVEDRPIPSVSAPVSRNSIVCVVVYMCESCAFRVLV